MYITLQMFGVSKIFLFFIFIQQDCTKIDQCDIKDFYSTHFVMLFFWTFQ